MESVHKYARLSLASSLLTVIPIMVNHLYVFGFRAFVLGGVLVGALVALLLWFRNTRSRMALFGYVLVNLWIIIGFGLIKGLWGTMFRLFLGTLLASVSTSFPKPTIGSFGFEISGVLMFIGSLFVLYYGYTLILALRDASTRSRSVETTTRRKVVLASSSVIGVSILAGAYGLSVRDAWEEPSKGVVKIGVIAPTQGPYALLGNGFVKAVEMAEADLENTKYRYQLLIRDPGPNPAQAVEVIRKLIENDEVNAVVGAVSLIGQVTTPYATRARIPHLCVCTVLPIGDGAYNFTNIPTPEAEGIRWVQEAQKRRIKTIAVIAQDYPSINNHVKALKAEAARAGLPIVYENSFAASVTDFTPIIAAARVANPDVYYVEALYPALDILGQQLSDTKIRNIASVVAPSLSEKPQLFEGVWYTDSDLADMGFKGRFEQKYPGSKFATHMMPYAYDSFNMIVRAYEQGDNPAVFIRNITSYDGAAGRVIKERGSGNFKSDPVVWTIRNGKPSKS
jgi:ABC-type branched-subunit amino acid transport system substrate-binding protein